jgi:hypothetical protein
MERDEVDVLFCDENPGLTLYLPGDDMPSAAVSFWRSALSPVGAGHVLVLWRRNLGGVGEATVQAYADNRALGRAVLDTFIRHWPPFDTAMARGVEVRASRFSVEVDARRFYRVACVGTDIDLAAEWRDLRLARRYPAHTHAGVSYDGAALIVEDVVCYCESVAVRIDGAPVAGESRPESGGGMSAYVTLCETWYPATQGHIEK